jgi:hypothetical protein
MTPNWNLNGKPLPYGSKIEMRRNASTTWADATFLGWDEKEGKALIDQGLVRFTGKEGDLFCQNILVPIQNLRWPIITKKVMISFGVLALYCSDGTITALPYIDKNKFSSAIQNNETMGGFKVAGVLIPWTTKEIEIS